MAAKTIEEMIDSDHHLALLADMANLDKHTVLTRRLHSGELPVIGKVGGEQPGSGGGWRLRLEVTHKGQVYDGLDIGRQAIDAWRGHLKAWGLI